MPVCVVCGKEIETLVCEGCGFDGSCDYETYPSLVQIQPDTLSVGKRMRQKKIDRTRIHCPQCQKTDFSILTEDLVCVCTACGAVLNMDHIKIQQQALSDEKTAALLGAGASKVWEPGVQHRGPHNKLAISRYHTVLVQRDGSVKAAGENFDKQCNVDIWKNIEEVAASDISTIGRTGDGTVLVAGSAAAPLEIHDATAIDGGGYNFMILRENGTVMYMERTFIGKYTFFDPGWENIAAISVGQDHAVGLRADGTVESVGSNLFGRCNVSDWTDIVAVAAGGYHTVGLRSDGTLLATGSNHDGQCQWNDIRRPVAAIAAGCTHSVILLMDGTVEAVGNNDKGQCNVSDWKDVVAIAAAGDRTVGLTRRGKLLKTGRMQHLTIH